MLEQRDPDALVRTIERALVEHAAPDHACILKVLPEGYEPVTAHELDLSGPRETWGVSFTALGRCREQALAILATDVLSDPKFDRSGSIQKLHIRSVICVPLGSDPVRGVVYLDRRSRSRPFDREDLQFVAAVSVYATLALERLEDHFLEMYCRGTRKKTFSSEALDLMQRYPWEFNVRQLQQVVESVVCLLDKGAVGPEDLPAFLQAGTSASIRTDTSASSPYRPGPLRDVVEAAEKEHILRTIEHTKGNRRKAIELLDVSSDTFYKRLKRFGLIDRDPST